MSLRDISLFRAISLTTLFKLSSKSSILEYNLNIVYTNTAKTTMMIKSKPRVIPNSFANEVLKCGKIANKLITIHNKDHNETKNNG